MSMLDGLDHLVPEGRQEEPPLTPEMEAVDPRFSKTYNERADLLRGYLALAENAIDLHDENYRRVVFPKLSYGLRKAGEYLGWALYHQRMAAGQRKQAEAIAALDEFGKYIVKKKNDGVETKSTMDVRNHYVNIDPGVVQAVAKEAYMDAVVAQLSTMKMEFTMAISTIKAMAFGSRDSDYMSSSSVSVNERE